MVYYAGHGIEVGGENYLIPIDATIRATTDLPVVALALDDQLAAIELAGAGGTIFVIDACRNTPLSLTRNGRGFAPMNAATDTLIAFSTAPGEIAEDDGLYARTLAEEIALPGVDISTVFQRVQVRVAEATKRKQRPRYDNGLLSPLVMVSQLPALSAQARSAPDLMPPDELAALGARSVA
ncbi:MAG TPA: caspase family protein, partial [Tepidisphaeraceae bacterium]|nr:caspase family protein [Tepidisphaeraceae bacterium]